MTWFLSQEGFAVNPKRVRRLLRLMGLEALYPKPRLSLGDGRPGRFPYLLRGVSVERVNQVWCTDLTYIQLAEGFIYLTVILDWRTRYVIRWRLSHRLEGHHRITTSHNNHSRSTLFRRGMIKSGWRGWGK